MRRRSCELGPQPAQEWVEACVALQEKEVVMENVKIERDGDILRFEVDLTEEGEPSSTGKTMIIGKTGGWVSLDHLDKGLKVNLNVARKNTR